MIGTFDMWVVLALSSIFFTVSIFILKPIALKYQLVDFPDSRKQHTGHIPLIGGQALFITIIPLACYFMQSSSLVTHLLIAITIITLVGLYDDKFNLNSKIKFLIQVGVAIFLAYQSGVQLPYFGNLIGFGNLNLGIFAGPVAVFSLVVGMNAFNMLDGIDGLSASMCLVSLGTMAILADNSNLQLMGGIVIASLIVFLLFNLGMVGLNNKIFLGDSGSMLLGLIIAWFLIVASQNDTPDFKPVTALWIIAIPLIDMTSVMLKRLRQGRSMLEADREHLHHKLMDAGMSSRQALIIIVFFAIILVGLGLLMDRSNLPEYYSFYLFLMLLFVYNFAHSKFSKHQNIAQSQ
jgi:UDP-GlcNAc:undecaprenyl-phosphate GlcNAc-1-phosphate transferase